LSLPSFPSPFPSPSPDASGTSASPHPWAELARWGWDDGWAAAFAPYAERGLLPGRVLRVDRGRCDLATPAGPIRADTALVTPPDPVRTVCTGDWAAVEPGGAPPLVRALLPRRTAFLRSATSKRAEGQVLAANTDLAVIAISLQDALDLGRLERFVSLAWSGGAQPVVALTKADLVADPTFLLADAREAAPGVDVLAVSSAAGTGLAELAALLAGRTSVLLGQSGAGKSTLANALAGREAQLVQAVRDADGKGRHTTTTRDMIALPGGGVLVDTPGVRGVGLWEADDGLGRTFADVEALAAACRFSDCSHAAEPGCAVLAALENGELTHRRLESYRKLLRENAWIASRTDARLRAELRKEWKRRGAQGQADHQRKRGGDAAGEGRRTRR
jgi:ribosome biogenesis GTPase